MIAMNHMNKKYHYTHWDFGWEAYWNGVNQNNCPTWEDQKMRDEWMLGWLAAQFAAAFEKELVSGLTNADNQV